MSPAEQTSATGTAVILHGAMSVCLRVRGCGTAVAVAGIVGRALRTLDIPFCIRMIDVPDTAVHGGIAAVVGLSDADADLELDLNDTISVVHGPGVDPDPVVTLTGLHAVGTIPKEDTDLASAAADAGIEAGPGVAVPTGDPAGGLAHSTLVHAPLSVDRERTQAGLVELSLPAELGADARKRVTSLIAVDATSDEATVHATIAVEHVLGPETTPSGPFETVSDFVDMLDTTIRESLGTTVALTLGHDVRNAAPDAWRDHTQVTHAVLRGTTTGRYESLSTLSCDLSSPERFAMVARLAHDSRPPGPAVLAVGVGVTALVSTDPAGLSEDLVVAVSGLPIAFATGSPPEATMTPDSTAESSDVVTTVRGVRR